MRTVIVSTVGVGLSVNDTTLKGGYDALPEGADEIDRTSINAWQDPNFRAAIDATGGGRSSWRACGSRSTSPSRRSICSARAYEVYPVADAIGGISRTTHGRAIERMHAAGVTPITALQFDSELMRD